MTRLRLSGLSPGRCAPAILAALDAGERCNGLFARRLGGPSGGPSGELGLRAVFQLPGETRVIACPVAPALGGTAGTGGTAGAVETVVDLLPKTRLGLARSRTSTA